MIQLVYVSSAVEPMSRDALLELLVTARENNARLGVTGMLLYKDGNFMQLLEGQADVVRPLYEKICRDPRHHGEIVILDETVGTRQFADWSMAFRDLDDPAVQAIPGYSPYMNRALSGQEFAQDPTGSLGLLRLFRQS